VDRAGILEQSRDSRTGDDESVHGRLNIPSELRRVCRVAGACGSSWRRFETRDRWVIGGWVCDWKGFFGDEVLRAWTGDIMPVCVLRKNRI
jgi:hypothetical protein